MNYITELAKELIDVPEKWKIIIFEEEEWEVVALAYNEIFAVTNNEHHTPSIFSLDDYLAYTYNDKTIWN